MEFIIAILTIIIVLFCIYKWIPMLILKITKNNNNDILTYTSKSDKYKARYGFYVDYYGGYNDIGKCYICGVDFCKNLIHIKFTGNCSGKDFIEERDIKYEDITNVSLKTEEEIKQSPSFSKVFLFGILGFAMKGKENITTNNFVVITTKYNNLILKVEDYRNFVHKLDEMRTA